MVREGAITAAVLDSDDAGERMPAKWFNLLLSALSRTPLRPKRSKRRLTRNGFVSPHFNAVLPIRLRLIQMTGWLDTASNDHWQRPSPIIMKPTKIQENLNYM